MIVFEEPGPLCERARSLDLAVRVGEPAPGDLYVRSCGLSLPDLGPPGVSTGQDIPIAAITWLREGAPLLPQLLGQVCESHSLCPVAWVANAGHLPNLHRRAHGRVLAGLADVSGPVSVEFTLAPRGGRACSWQGIRLATQGLLGYAVAGLVDDFAGSLAHVYGRRQPGTDLKMRPGCCAALRFYPDDVDELVGSELALFDDEPESIIVLGRGKDPAMAIHAAAETARRYSFDWDLSGAALEAKRDLERALRRFGGGKR